LNTYGKELIIDLHSCNINTFNRESIEKYFVELCDLIDMQRCELHFWDDTDVAEEDKQILPHTKGTSAVQFILTSNITIHTLDILGKVFINIFSCKDFDEQKALRFTEKFFKGNAIKYNVIERV
jgi:S-adenosylmethionine/arginine decarboxylase-like enzyme